MTEEEWLACTDPQKMLEFLRGKASDRKLRSFACACCRRCKERLDEVNQLAIEVAELFADSRATVEALRERRMRTVSWMCYVADTNALLSALKVIKFRTEEEGWKGCTELCGRGYMNDLWLAERRALGTVLLDMFGNPFRPVAVDAPWLTPPVVKLAQAIYEERAFDRLPVLADALEEAGCADPDILSHCRGPGPHVKGCWLVDLLLGKS
jgi:hypothetical protein